VTDRSSYPGGVSVSVELIAFGICHRDCKVVVAFLVECLEAGSPKVLQSDGLCLHLAPPRRQREFAITARLDAKVRPVLADLRFRHHVEPNAWPFPLRINHRFRTGHSPDLLLSDPDAQPILTPASVALRWWLGVVTKGRTPRRCKPSRVMAINHDLEANGHNTSPVSGRKSAVASRAGRLKSGSQTRLPEENFEARHTTRVGHRIQSSEIARTRRTILERHALPRPGFFGREVGPPC
jgi:hypothetical protein